MKLSIVIPCYNAEKTIAEQLDSLVVQGWRYPWEVIVADNGSRDGSRAVVESYRGKLPALKYLDASSRPGPAHARNRGVEQARGELIAFLDADDVAGENWLAKMGDSLLIHPFVASRFDGERLNPPGNTVVPQMNGLLRSSYLPYSGGCGLGVRKEIHEKVGGFDENFLACEDGDYCWRIQLQGIPLHYQQDAVVHCRNRVNPRQQYAQGVTWGEYNVMLAKKFIPLGFRKPTLKEGARRWLEVYKRFRNRNGRAMWALGFRVGSIKGSIKHRLIVL